jgi:superkiller protein 3
VRFIIFGLAVLLSIGTGDAGAAGDDEQLSARGVELLKQGKTSQAIDEFLRVIELNPRETASRMNLAVIYEREGRLDEAIYHYEKVLNVEPRNVTAHNNLGVLYSRKGSHDESIGEFEAVLEIDGKNAQAAKNLDVAKKTRDAAKERERQIESAKKAAEANPKNPGAVYNLARAYAFYGKKEDALAWLDKAISLGYNDLAYLKTDSALESLRNDPEYQRLMAGR